MRVVAKMNRDDEEYCLCVMLYKEREEESMNMRVLLESKAGPEERSDKKGMRCMDS